MKKTLSVLFAFIIVLGACKKEESDLVSKLVNKITKIESVHYKINLQSYASNLTDTTKTKYEVWLKNTPEKYIWVDDFYRPSHFILENGKYFLTIPPKKTTIEYPNLDEDMISPVDWISVFTKPESFKKMLLDKKNQVIISDTIFENEKGNSIKIIFPTDGHGEQIVFKYILSEAYQPKWSMLQRINSERKYTQELFFTDYTLNTVNKKELKERHATILANNPLKDGSGETETTKLESMLKIGEKAPLFKGSLYGTNTSFEFENYIGKNVIILDFWYTHCPPCVKAIPELIKLQEEYKKEGLMTFGLNSVDNNERSKKTLDKFLEKRELNYNVILTESEVDLAYKIKSYPSLYVIDKNGKVAFIEIGFDTDNFKLFKEKVIALLKS